MGTRRKVTYR